MKQLLVIAIALASTTAFASRARVTSLGNSPHVIDTQRIYMNPANMFSFGDFVNMESGTTAQGAEGTNTEGMLVRSMGDAKMGLSLGHRSKNASAFGLRAIYAQAAGVSTTMTVVNNQQNPIELSYGMKAGDLTWAATLVYSNYDDKRNGVKESSAGLRLGALTGAWDIALGLGLGNKVETTAAPAVDFEGTMGISAYAGYTMDSMYYYGEVILAGAKMDVGGAEQANVDSTTVTLGAVDSLKKDGNEFFYGAKLVNTMVKNEKTAVATDDTEDTSLTLPVIVGLEAEATSWMTLRGSLTQTVLINDSKAETGSTTTAEFAPGANNTVAAIGAGLKFNKVTIDGSLQGLTGGAANQQLNGNTLLSTVGLTYMF